MGMGMGMGMGVGLSNKIKILKLNNNKIQQLTPWICTLNELECLDISKNQITHLIANLGLLNKLIDFRFNDNPIEYPRIDILMLDTKYILKYLREQLYIEVPNKYYRISIVGQDNVGKSSLAYTLKENQVNQSNISTDGISIDHWLLEIDNLIQFQLPSSIMPSSSTPIPPSSFSSNPSSSSSAASTSISSSSSSTTYTHHGSSSSSSSASSYSSSHFLSNYQQSSLSNSSPSQRSNDIIQSIHVNNSGNSISTSFNPSSSSSSTSSTSSSFVNTNNHMSGQGSSSNNTVNNNYALSGSTTIGNQLLPVSSSVSSTIPSSNTMHMAQSMHIHTSHIDVSLWDFAGQEIYYTTHELFLLDQSIYIIVWYILQNDDDTKLLYWLESIKSIQRNKLLKSNLILDHPGTDISNNSNNNNSNNHTSGGGGGSGNSNSSGQVIIDESQLLSSIQQSISSSSSGGSGGNGMYQTPTILVATHIDHESCSRDFMMKTLQNIADKYTCNYPFIKHITAVSTVTQKGFPELRMLIKDLIRVNHELLQKSIPSRYKLVEQFIINQLRKERKPPIITMIEFI